MLGKQLTQAAAGSAAGEALYVDDVFSTYLYEGTSSTQSINNGVDLSGEGGLVWIKVRDTTDNHLLYDTERGATKQLISNSSNSQSTESRFSSFNSNGFTVTTNDNEINQTVYDYASWTFRKAPGFFDVVTYTGNDAASQSVAHNLGSVPGMVVVKDLGTNSWYVYHRSEGAGKYGVLNSTAAFTSSTVIWGNTTPTSTHFYVGSSGGGTAVNGNGRTYVAYVFAHDDQSFGTDSNESIIKCGTFTATLGNNVDLGFEPQFVLLKSASATGDWYVVDTMRGLRADQGSSDQFLSANTSAAEVDSTNGLALTQTGFKSFNASNQTYIYIAIRRPHKPPTAATEVLDIISRSGTSTTTVVSSNIEPVDFALVKSRTTTNRSVVGARLTGNNTLTTSENYAESLGVFGTSINPWDSQNGVEFRSDGDVNGAATYINYFLRRAPGFFDIVAYGGTGAVQNISHNLGVKPDFMLVKRRSSAASWLTYNSISGATKYQVLDTDAAEGTGSTPWNNTEPNATQFTVGTASEVNANNSDYIAYLFASLDGISKVGSYTGTGNDIDIDCGFTNGARFVMVKRTDASGDWFVMDSARGITAGDDPYILLNSSAAEVNNNSIIDADSSGFQITDDAPAGLNASGGTYLFLAIA